MRIQRVLSEETDNKGVQLQLGRGLFECPNRARVWRQVLASSESENSGVVKGLPIRSVRCALDKRRSLATVLRNRAVCTFERDLLPSVCS